MVTVTVSSARTGGLITWLCKPFPFWNFCVVLHYLYISSDYLPAQNAVSLENITLVKCHVDLKFRPIKPHESDTNSVSTLYVSRFFISLFYFRFVKIDFVQPAFGNIYWVTISQLLSYLIKSTVTVIQSFKSPCKWFVLDFRPSMYLSTRLILVSDFLLWSYDMGVQMHTNSLRTVFFLSLLRHVLAKICCNTEFGIFVSVICTYFKEPGWRSRYSDWLQAGRPRGHSKSPGRVKNFLCFTSSRPALRPTQPPTQMVLAALSPGVKRPGREADHSTPTSAEVKKMCIYTSTPPYVFMG
jgi:hypothetical protein